MENDGIKTNNEGPSRPNYLPLKRQTAPEDVIERADSVINIPEEDELTNEEQSAKSRLMNIVIAERKRSKQEQEQLSQQEQQEEVEQSFKANFVSSVRKSFRRIKSLGVKKDTSKSDTSAKQLGKKSHGGNCNESQDSGLGEDSDFEAGQNKDTSLSLTTTPGTTTNLSVTCPSSASLTSSLRKSGAVTSTVKHVMIKEPCLSVLPSARRSVTVRQCRKETVKIYPRPNRVPHVIGPPTGSVSDQWGHIMQMAQDCVRQNVVKCHVRVIQLIFNPNESEIRFQLEKLDDADDTSLVIHGVYKIIFFDWLNGHVRTHLAIILNSLQRFLIILVDLVDLDMDDRLRFAKFFRDLLGQCETSGYKNLQLCLMRTRRLYIDLWCALLLTPFSGQEEITSPTVSEIRRSMNAKRLNM